MRKSSAKCREFLENIRKDNNTIPTIIITAKNGIEDIKRGFILGVDDYMVKPIDFGELSLRIKAVLRRARIVNERKIVIGETILDYNSLTVSNSQNKVCLTKKEFGILYKLLSYPKKTFTRTQLMDEFWDANTDAAPRAVDVYMTKLRSKLSECNDFEIVTVHGLGYKAVLK